MFKYEVIHSPLFLREELPGDMMGNFALSQDEFSMLPVSEMIDVPDLDSPSAWQDLMPMTVMDVQPDWGQSLIREKQPLDGATALPSTATDGIPSVPRPKPPSAPETSMDSEMMEWMPRPNRGEPQPNFRGGMMPKPDALLGTEVEAPWICTLMEAPVESVDEAPVMPLFSHHPLMSIKPLMQMLEPGFSMQHPFPRLSDQDAIADLGAKRSQGRRSRSVSAREWRQGHWAQHLERFRQERSSCGFSMGMESTSTRPLLLGKSHPFPGVFAHGTERAMGLDSVSSELSMPQA